MNGPSKHLSWAELACKDASRTPYPHVWRGDRAVWLAEAFEDIRAVIGGQPILIGSGYRTPEYNKLVGGARASQHIEGRALDLYPPRGWTVERFHDAILRAIRGAVRLDMEGGIGRVRGLGQYPTFVHVDIRPGRYLIRWRGSRAWAEMVDGGPFEGDTGVRH